MSRYSFTDGNSLQARQALADNKCEHGPKRHRTAKRISQAAKAKHKATKHKIAMAAKERLKHKRQAHLYWTTGEVDYPD